VTAQYLESGGGIRTFFEDGTIKCCGCSPWAGSHLPGGRRVPAAREARGLLAASPRCPGGHHTGAAPLPLAVWHLGALALGARDLCARCWGATLLGHGPHEGPPCAGDGHDDWHGVLTPGTQRAVAPAPPHVRVPADLLAGVRPRGPTALARSAHVSRIASGPGAFDQAASGLGLARLGAASLATALAPGSCRRRPARVTPERSGMVTARQIPQGRDAADGHGAWPPAEHHGLHKA
jgi:hypothetical protein